MTDAITTKEEETLEYLLEFRKGVEAFGKLKVVDIKRAYESASPGWLKGYGTAVSLYNKGASDTEKMFSETREEELDDDL